MTPLTKPVHRISNKRVGSRRVIITIAPGSNDDAIGLRLQGQRTTYVCLLSDIYRMAALWHANKEAAAKREARKNHIPWRKAKAAMVRQLKAQLTK